MEWMIPLLKRLKHSNRAVKNVLPGTALKACDIVDMHRYIDYNQQKVSYSFETINVFKDFN